MCRLFIAISILLLIFGRVPGQALEFDDKGNNELCDICSCSIDKSSVDCSRRGLADIPEGLTTEVRIKMETIESLNCITVILIL